MVRISKLTKCVGTRWVPKNNTELITTRTHILIKRSIPAAWMFFWSSPTRCGSGSEGQPEVQRGPVWVSIVRQARGVGGMLFQKVWLFPPSIPRNLTTGKGVLNPPAVLQSRSVASGEEMGVALQSPLPPYLGCSGFPCCCCTLLLQPRLSSPSQLHSKR